MQEKKTAKPYKQYGTGKGKPTYGNRNETGDRTGKKDYAPRGDRYEKKDYVPRGDRFEKKDSAPHGDRADRKPFAPKKPYAPRGDRFPRDNRRTGTERPVREERPVYTAEERMEEVGNGAVIGRNAVRELLKSGRAIDKVLVQRGERTGSIVVLVAEAIERNIPVVEVEKAKLDAIAGFAPHQGVIAMAAEKEYCEVEDILKIAEDRGEAPLIVIADGITDPYNLGALIRCAEGVGAHGLILPKRHAAGLTPLVSKASAGAIEHLAIAKVSNLTDTIKNLQKRGIWVFAAEAGGTPYYECNFKGACALVFGSEGDGVSRLVKETSDVVTSIPMYGHVNSFNVSTAAAVILAEASRQHRTGQA